MSQPAPSDHVTVNGKRVAMSFSSSVSSAEMELFVQWTPFCSWLSKIERYSETFTLTAIELQSVDLFGPRIGFAKFKASILGEDGEPLPGITFMRGGSIAVLMILRNQETGGRHTLLVQEPSVPNAEPLYPSLPAGMLDGDGNFGGAMAREIHEETGIVCEAHELIDMTALTYGDRFEGLYPSPGGCDEFIRFFCLHRTMSSRELAELDGKLTGVAAEGEKIKVRLLPFDDLWSATPDMKALTALTLYARLVQRGDIKPPQEGGGAGGGSGGRKRSEPA